MKFPSLTFRKIKFAAFTLIELVVVITILAILATIATVSFKEYITTSRDSVRMADIANISKGFELAITSSNSLPPPDANITTVTASGDIIGYQGYIWKNVLSFIHIGWGVKDPMDQKYYTYLVDTDNTGYQILGFLERNDSMAQNPEQPFNSFVEATYAAGYNDRIPYSKGNAFGIFLGTGVTVNTPIQETGLVTLDILQTTNPYTLYFSKDFIISWDKSIIGTPSYISFKHSGNGLSAPSDCPEGFISVPGNTDFRQPGFCVAKYEMSYVDATIPNSWLNSANKDPNALAYDGNKDWNTVDYIDGKIPVSSAWLYPIVNISQTSAIKACQSMWEGYHLITNSEWMTIARNIEANPDNWSSGIVGNGGIYRGITGETNSGTSLGCTTGDSAGKSGIAGRIYAARSLSIDTTLFSSNKANDCDSKRQLKLSNGQIIWDVSGNIWEHVNKADTLDATNIDTDSFATENFCNAGWWGWYSWYDNDGVNFCNFKDPLAKSKYGPKGNYNASNGIGRIYGSNAEDRSNVFIRGRYANGGESSGIFALSLAWSASASDRLVGFRCAR